MSASYGRGGGLWATLGADPSIPLGRRCPLCHDVAMTTIPTGEAQRVEKPWGYEIWYAHTDDYAGKILHVNQGQRLSLQYHEHKDESNYLLSGRLLLIKGESADALTEQEIGPGRRGTTARVRSTRSRRCRMPTCSRCPRRSSTTSCGSRTTTAARARAGPSRRRGQWIAIVFVTVVLDQPSIPVQVTVSVQSPGAIPVNFSVEPTTAQLPRPSPVAPTA